MFAGERVVDALTNQLLQKNTTASFTSFSMFVFFTMWNRQCLPKKGPFIRKNYQLSQICVFCHYKTTGCRKISKIQPKLWTTTGYKSVSCVLHNRGTNPLKRFFYKPPNILQTHSGSAMWKIKKSLKFLNWIEHFCSEHFFHRTRAMNW